MSTSLPVPVFSEEEKVGLIESFRKEADAYADGSTPDASLPLCPLDHPSSSLHCECDKTRKAMSIDIANCERYAKCLVREVLFSNGTYE